MATCMKVGKWGNSLAVRLPREVVERLGLKEGDELEMEDDLLLPDRCSLRRRMSAEEAAAELKAMRGAVPAGYVWSRDHAYEDLNRKWGIEPEETQPDDAPDAA